jgi:hypothetical protein
LANCLPSGCHTPTRRLPVANAGALPVSVSWIRMPYLAAASIRLSICPKL